MAEHIYCDNVGLFIYILYIQFKYFDFSLKHCHIWGTGRKTSL